MNFKEYSELMRPEIEQEMKSVIDESVSVEFPELKYMLTYHLGWDGEGAGVKAQGKRVRPLILLISAEASGGDWRKALPAAAAVELLHNFSLIHDDVQDQSLVRRGRPTVWAKWGEAQAINAGDLMFTLSNLAVLRLNTSSSSRIALESARIFNKTCVELTKGQYLDMSYEDKKVLPMEAYWPMVSGKTAALLACCADLGALIGGAGKKLQAQYREFAYYLGLAFQAWDDWLGIWGDAAIVGKSTDSDLVTGKKTLPILFGLSQKRRFEARWLEGSITSEEVPEIAELLDEEGAKEFTIAEADRLTNKALDALNSIGSDNDAAKTLLELSNLLIKRQN